MNNHGSIVEYKGNWYIFYHRPTHGTSSMRKVCVEPIHFNSDGTIQEVEMTTQGVSGPMNPLLRMEASRACQLQGHLVVRCQRHPEDTPVEYLSQIRHGDQAYWRYYDFNKQSISHFECKTWQANAEADIEIRLDAPDGELLGTCHLRPMNGDVNYQIHRTAVRPVKGVHALVLVFKSPASVSDQDLLNLEWFRFTQD